MGNGLDTKHAFAFGIDLERQLATVQLEDRQISSSGGLIGGLFPMPWEQLVQTGDWMIVDPA